MTLQQKLNTGQANILTPREKSMTRVEQCESCKWFTSYCSHGKFRKRKKNAVDPECKECYPLGHCGNPELAGIINTEKLCSRYKERWESKEGITIPDFSKEDY